MAKRHYHLDTRILALFFLVGIPFVVFGSFVVVSMARGLLHDSLGQSMEQRAVQTKILLERYMGDQIVHLHLTSLDPQVRAATTAKPSTGAEDSRKLEQAWAAGSDPRLAAITDSPLAGRFREILSVRPAVKMLQLVDASGRLVASSGRGGRLQNAEAPWFRALTGREPYVGDINRAGPHGIPLLDISYPVWDQNEYRMLGAVRALLDTSDLYGVLAPVRIGRTGHAVLLRSSDGLVLASDESQTVLAGPLPGFDAIGAAMRERRGYWVIPEVKETREGKEVRVEPQRLVGYSPVEQVPGAQWLVVVEQDLEEAAAPLQSVTRYLWLHLLGVFATVILLALYFSFKLETPVIEEELHLHEEHVPPSLRKVV